MNETKKEIPAWQEFLSNCDEAEAKDRPLWDLYPDMDTEEIFAKSEAIDFFKKRDLSPQVEMALSNAMDKLPLIQGTILRAIFWRGMTVAEVAKGLKIAPMAVYKAKSRGLKELKRMLSSKGLDVKYGPRESSTISEV